MWTPDDLGVAVCHYNDDGTIEIVECAPTVMMDREILKVMLDTHNKYQHVVNAAKLVVLNMDEDAGGDFEMYADGLDQLEKAVAAL